MEWTNVEIKFTPEEKPKEGNKELQKEDLVCGFPPERFAEMDENTLWNV